MRRPSLRRDLIDIALCTLCALLLASLVWHWWFRPEYTWKPPCAPGEALWMPEEQHPAGVCVDPDTLAREAIERVSDE